MKSKWKDPSKTCGDCVHRWACAAWNVGGIDGFLKQDAKNCSNFQAEIPKTNGDHIRAMSDEDAVDYLLLNPEVDYDVCKCCFYGNKVSDDRGICLTQSGSCCVDYRADALKEWLKQPYKEGK